MRKRGRATHITLKSILVLMCMIFLCTWCCAQLCTGSLGDPVVNITFGSGSNPGGPLSAASTNYNYTTDSCPSDGSYTVCHNSGGCYADSWHTLHQDHTGDPNGFYMLVNASYAPGIFYNDTVHGLCGNTTYEFAAWILNLLKPNNVCGPTGIEPNITFTIQKLNGSVIQTYNTGDIAPTDSINWTQYGFYFTTQPNLTDVIIRMTNNAPGGCGNDLAMDDITFRPCGSMVNINIAGNNNSHIKLCLDSANHTVVLNGTVSAGYDNPAYQWEQSIDSGKTWQDMPNQTTETLNLLVGSATPAATYLYRLTLAEAQNIGSPGCRVVSNVDTVALGFVPLPVIANNGPFCPGSNVLLSVSGGATYNWAGPDNFSSSNDSVVIAGASAANAGEYYVNVVSPQGCAATDSTLVLVGSLVAKAGPDTTVCQGTVVQLNASGGQTYSWVPSSTLSSTNIPNPLAAPVDTTSYIVTVAQNRCSMVDTVTINVVKQLTVSGDSAVCAGSSINLSASNGKSYVWTGPNGFNATRDSVTITHASLLNAGQYFVTDTTNKVCFNRDSATVAVHNPAAQAGKDTAMCSGASVQLKGSGNGSFAWSPAAGLSSPNIPNPVASPATTTTYILTVTQSGCTAQDSLTIAVYTKLQASNNGPLCAGSNLALTATGGSTYKWTGPGGFTALGGAVNIAGVSIANAGSYLVADTTDHACVDTVSTNVVIYNPQANAGKDTTVCEGTSLQLNGSGNGTFLWQPPTGLSAANISSPLLTATQTTQYVLTVTDGGCAKTDTVEITAVAIPIVNAGGNKTIIAGQSVMLQGSISDTSLAFYWSPALYMNDSLSLTPVVHPPADITYTLHLTSGNVCGNAFDSVFVKVYDNILIPNVFSPNGDGINDTWQIQALASYSDADVSIFNRWGQIVFHSTGYANPWDGNYNGKPLPLATYYYVINLKNNTPVLSGWVAILR